MSSYFNEGLVSRTLGKMLYDRVGKQGLESIVKEVDFALKLYQNKDKNATESRLRIAARQAKKMSTVPSPDDPKRCDAYLLVAAAFLLIEDVDTAYSHLKSAIMFSPGNSISNLFKDACTTIINYRQPSLRHAGLLEYKKVYI